MKYFIQPLARAIEAIAKNHNFHVALTGGQLYKEGTRKDTDFVFYRVRKTSNDINLLFKDLEKMGVKMHGNYGFVRKASFEGNDIDFLFPEYDLDSDYYPITTDVIVENTALPTKPVTSPERMEWLKQNHEEFGMAVYFRYPLWDVWMYIDSPSWNPNIHYMLKAKRPATTDDWIRPVTGREQE